MSIRRSLMLLSLLSQSLIAAPSSAAPAGRAEWAGGNGGTSSSGTGVPELGNRGEVMSIDTAEYRNGVTAGASGTAPSMPEPETWMLMLAGFGVALMGLRRR